MFAITYTIFRVILIPYAYYWHIRYIWNWSDVIEPYMLVCSIITEIIWALISVMNYYWYYIILKSMALMLGILKKGEDPADEGTAHIGSSKEVKQD